MRINIVDLTGIVGAVSVQRDNETGDYVQGRIALTVIRGSKRTGTSLDVIAYDTPWVISSDPIVIKQMENIKENDIVRITGTFTTTNVIKSTYCPEESCHTKYEKKGTLVYISPYEVMQIRTNIDKGTANDFLKEYCNVSNKVIIGGKLAFDPKSYTTDKSFTMTQYSLICPRQKEIAEDSTMSPNDFPMIRTYGKIAESNKKYLHKDSSVLINGVIQTRQYDMKVVCPKCGLAYSQLQSNMEIIPYAVEYLENYYTKEDLERMAEEEADDNDIEQITDEDKNDSSDLYATDSTNEKDLQNQLIDSIVDFDD